MGFTTELEYSIKRTNNMIGELQELVTKKWYVVGYMFSPDFSKIVLIRKNRPSWQYGLLNGVGGKVEKDEDPLGAMSREFFEETGIWHTDWKTICTLDFPEARVWFFWTVSPAYDKVQTQTDESVGIHVVRDLQDYTDLVHNANWIIAMALSFQRGERADSFNVKEIYNVRPDGEVSS
jgi:8-oxo-dGTP diphosphatase